MLIDDLRIVLDDLVDELLEHVELRDRETATITRLRGFLVAYDALSPDWSQAPEWAQWYAIDSDGYAHWFDNEPVMHPVSTHRDVVVPHWSHVGSKGVMYDAHNLPLGIDWRLCLWEKPKENA